MTNRLRSTPILGSDSPIVCIGSASHPLLRACLVFFVLLLVPTPFSWGATINVPSDYSTIQAAVNAAQVSDLVLVAPGTYAGNVLITKSLHLESSGGPGVTILDGGGSGSVLNCVGAGSGGSIVGFTILNGTGEFVGPGRFGGGIRCWNGSSPRIEDNIIRANVADYGGGIGCRYGSVPTVINNEIHSNTASREGGGVYAIDAHGLLIRVESNSIHDNTANSSGTSSGGGIWLGAVDLEVIGNEVYGNLASNGGGGIWAGFSGGKTIRGNIIRNNHCANLGGGVWLSQGSFARGAVMDGNTLYQNSAPFGGGIAFGYGDMDCQYNIISYSTQGAGLFGNVPANVNVSCNNIRGNAGGDSVPGNLVDAGGNIFLDPQFADPQNASFCLALSSPCLPSANGCGVLMGAKDACTGPIPVKKATWGKIKRLSQN